MDTPRRRFCKLLRRVTLAIKSPKLSWVSTMLMLLRMAVAVMKQVDSNVKKKSMFKMIVPLVLQGIMISENRLAMMVTIPVIK